MADVQTLTLCGRGAPLWRPAVRQTGEEVLNNVEVGLAGHTDVLIPRR